MKLFGCVREGVLYELGDFAVENSTLEPTVVISESPS